MKHHFSIEESLKFGWTKTRAHSALLFQVLLTLFALEVVGMIISSVLEHSLIGFLASVAIGVGQFVVGVGLTIITLRIAEGKHVEYKEIVPSGELLWRYLLASLLSALIVMGGFILLIIPGIYFALRLSMVRFAILDGANVMDALEKSGKMTDGAKWHLLGFFVVMLVINIVGAMLLLVGLLVTMPVTMIAYAHIYQKLKARHAHTA